jgi:hypothetical protein
MGINVQESAQYQGVVELAGDPQNSTVGGGGAFLEGAVGDGTTDNAQAFNDAIELFPSSTESNYYSIITLETGKSYYIGSSINLDGKRVQINGNGAVITTRSGTHSAFYKTTHDDAPIFKDIVFNGAGTAIELNCTASLNEHNDLIVQDCTFRMSGSNALLSGTVSNTTALTGTVSNTAASNALVGVGTLFSSELAVGDRIAIGTEIHTVLTITDDLNIVTLANISAAHSGIVYSKLSNTIVGSGTSFLSNFAAESYIRIGTSYYAVKSVADDTHLTIYGSLNQIASGAIYYKVTPAYGLKIYGARHPKIINCNFDNFQTGINAYTMVGAYVSYSVEPLFDHCTFQRCMRAVFAYGVGVDLIGSDALDAGLRLITPYIQGNVYGVRCEHWDLLEINGGLVDLNQQECLEGYALNQANIVNTYMGNTVGPVIRFEPSVRYPTGPSTSLYIANTKIHCHDNGSNGLFGAVRMNYVNQAEFTAGCEVTEWRGYGFDYLNTTYCKIHSSTVRPLPNNGIYSVNCPTGDSNTNEFFWNTYEKVIVASAILVEGCRNRLGTGVTRGASFFNYAIPTGTTGTYHITPPIGNTLIHVVCSPKGAAPPAGWYATNYSSTGFDFEFPTATAAGLSFDIMTCTNRSLFKM